MVLPVGGDGHVLQQVSDLADLGFGAGELVGQDRELVTLGQQDTKIGIWGIPVAASAGPVRLNHAMPGTGLFCPTSVSCVASGQWLA
jgi:hypothetical protein